MEPANLEAGRREEEAEEQEKKNLWIKKTKQDKIFF